MKFHKNLHIVALLATMVALNAQATPVSSVQACSAVSAWAAANGSAFANLGYAVSAVPEFDADGVTKLYYKVQMSNGGLVIASPDTDLDLVLAVLEKSNGNFPKGHPLPSILKADMRNRLSVISGGVSAASRASVLSATSQSTSATAANLPDDVKASIRESNALWAKYGNSSSAVRTLSNEEETQSVTTNVLRIVKGFEEGGAFTHWNQDYTLDGELCYNYYTPDNVFCGCVATAGAAIMQFFGNTTDIGVKSSLEGNECSINGKPLLDCKTIAGDVDWSSMANVTNVLEFSYEYDADGNVQVVDPGVYLLDDEGRELAGRIAYNIGVLVGMAWGGDGSGISDFSRLAAAFKAYGFSDARYVTFNTSDLGTSQYFKMIYAQNWAGVPVALSIRGGGRHAVVACGYAKTSDDEELCRVFMGWGGSGDAWYKFPKVEDYSIIDDAVTMIGYDASKDMDAMDVLGDEGKVNDLFNKYGTVPICGKVNRPNTKLEFPGVTKSAAGAEGEEGVTLTLTADVDENGFFAVRIPVGTEDLSIVHKETGTVLTIDPFDSKVLKDEKKNRSELEAAMPGEVLFLVLNTTVKSTVTSARARALEDGKAVLMISGSGSVRENLLVDYITYLDSNTDISNKFVIVRLNSSDNSSPDGDGDPSIGIFDPAEGSADFRWWSENGRLAYNNFIDYDADHLDGLKYLFNGTDATALTNIVDAVISTGYDTYARRHSGIEVAVRAIDEFGNPLTGLDGVEIQYGIHTNRWLEGDIVNFAAPEVYTNEVLGISFKCLGWVTNDVSIAKYIVTDKVASISLSNSLDFAWIWRTNAFRVVSAVSSNVKNNQDAVDAVTPAVTWVCPRDRVTIMAKGLLPTGNWGLNGWDIHGDLTKADKYSGSYVCVNGRAISFSVYEPIHVTANYSQRASEKADPQEYSVELSIDPPELADLLEGNASLDVGSNSTYDTTVSLAPYTSSIIDSTGGVWKCVGYVANGETNSIPESEHLSFTGDSASLQLVWELQEPEEEPVPEPGPISLTSLSRSSDGEWSIAVEGAIKGCWYTLYAADDISKLAGASDTWTADEVESKQASADGESIVFKMTPTANAQFWRVKASGTKE